MRPRHSNGVNHSEMESTENTREKVHLSINSRVKGLKAK